MNPTIDRMNALTEETTRNVLDAAFLAQTQSAQLVQSLFNTVTANQDATRNLALRMVKNAQEAQALAFGLTQDLVRNNAETWTRATEQQFRGVNETIDNASRTVKNGTKIETPGK